MGARKIFELGLKDYLTEPKYVCEYIRFLVYTKDHVNMRALCDRALATMAPENTAQVWAHYIDFECAYGDLTTIKKLAERKAEMLPDANPLRLALQRFRYKDLWPC